jgi:hypothetical protein
MGCTNLKHTKKLRGKNFFNIPEFVSKPKTLQKRVITHIKKNTVTTKIMLKDRISCLHYKVQEYLRDLSLTAGMMKGQVL